MPVNSVTSSVWLLQKPVESIKMSHLCVTLSIWLVVRKFLAMYHCHVREPSCKTTFELSGIRVN